MGVKEAAFLSSPASFHTEFLKHCGRYESLVTTMYVKTVVRVIKGKLLVIYLSTNNSFFCVSQII